MQVKNSGQLSPIGLTAVMLKVARYLSSKFDSSFIPIYGYFDGAVPIGVIRPAKSMPASVPALNDLQLFSTVLILRNRQPEAIAPGPTMSYQHDERLRTDKTLFHRKSRQNYDRAAQPDHRRFTPTFYSPHHQTCRR
jgi:hypothetical protein